MGRVRLGALGVLENSSCLRGLTMPKRIQRRTAGPGRPRKYPEGIKLFQAPVPAYTHNNLYELKEELNVPFSELLTWLVQLAKGEIDKLKLLARTRHQEEYIKQLEKEKQALLEELEKERQAREKAEKEAEYWRQQYYELKDKMKGKAAVSSRSTKIINALVKVIEEGKSWADAMSEIGIEHPQEQLVILKDLFVTKDDYGNIASVFYPLRTLKKLQGWVLVRGKEPGMVNYIFAREDTLRVAQQLKTEKAQSVPEVKRIVSPEQAKKEIRENLEVRVKIYERKLREGHATDAYDYLLKVQSRGLKRLIEAYGVDLVEDVIYSDPRFVDLFANSFASLKKKVKKKLEVKV